MQLSRQTYTQLGLRVYGMCEEWSCSRWCLVEAPGDVSCRTSTALLFTRPQLLVGSDPDCDLHATVRHTVLLGQLSPAFLGDR